MNLRTLGVGFIIFMSGLAYSQEDLIDDTKQAPHVSADNAAQLYCVGQYLDTFYTDCGRYPTTREGLDALIYKPKSITCKRWGFMTANGFKPYLTALPKDAFGHPWKYTSKDGNHYELQSLGADSKPGGTGKNADMSADDVQKHLPHGASIPKMCPGYDQDHDT